MRVEEHEPGQWMVERPEGVQEFIALAVRLYAQPEGELGGPLHAQLEDHNTDALVGERGRGNREELEAALALIEAGEAPSEKPVQYDPERAGADPHLYRIRLLRRHYRRARRVLREMPRARPRPVTDQGDATVM